MATTPWLANHHKQPLVDQILHERMRRFRQRTQALDSSPRFGIGVVELHKSGNECRARELFEFGMAVR